MPDVLYRYLLVVVDSAGNESKPTKVVSAKHIAVHDFAWIEPQVRVDRNKGIVNITIDKKYFTSSMVYIYGKQDDGIWRILQSISGSTGKITLPHDERIIKYIISIR